MDDITAYWTEALPNVEGWVNARWLEFFTLVNELQATHAITGELAEIGVFHGKLLIGLAHLLPPGGKVTALDVFDDQDKNIDGAGVGSLEKLKANIDRWGPRGIDWSFIKADSSALNAAALVTLTNDRGPFRLFSVDGCHTFEHTLNDLLTAVDCLSPGGVVILDDMFQPHWPGVTEAVSVFCARTPRVRPFLYCAHKLFFVGHGWHATFLRACTDRFASRADAKLTTMFGSATLSIFP